MSETLYPIKPINITGFITTNNVQNKARLAGPTLGNPTGPVECAAIVNADITDTLSLKRRLGQTLKLAGTPHSLWATPDGTQCYFVEGGYLKRLLPVLTSSVSVRALTSSEPMSYAQVNYITVCSNGFDLFYIENGVAYDFEFEDQRFKEAAEAGHLVALFNRRLFIAIDSVLYFTDADDIQRLDQRDDPIAFRARIRGIYPLKNGMFLMADKVYWISGMGPDEFSLDDFAYDAKLIPGTGVVYDGAMSGGSGKRVRFATDKGICDGDNSGNVQNLTMNTISITAQSRGAALIREQSGFNQYIAWI